MLNIKPLKARTLLSEFGFSLVLASFVVLIAWILMWVGQNEGPFFVIAPGFLIWDEFARSIKMGDKMLLFFVSILSVIFYTPIIVVGRGVWKWTVESYTKTY